VRYFNIHALRGELGWVLDRNGSAGCLELVVLIASGSQVPDTTGALGIFFRVIGSMPSLLVVK